MIGTYYSYSVKPMTDGVDCLCSSCNFKSKAFASKNVISVDVCFQYVYG